MARARGIKPGFYKNEDLAECSVWARLIFPGLWMLADREGRLEDRPKRIKGELLPFDAQDVEPLLAELARRGFLVRYRNSCGSFIQISKFKEHQSPHYSEKHSVIKPPEFLENESTISPANSEKSPVIKRGPQPPSSLTPSSPIPDSGLLTASSLTPDSGKPLSEGVAQKPRATRRANGNGSEAPTAETWSAYSEAYLRRYGVEPKRNATVNGQLSHFVGRIGVEESPAVAAFYVSHCGAFYVQKQHPVGLMLKDAEGLHTQWLSGHRVTETEARQADRTAATGEVFGKLIEEANGLLGVKR